ncbi:hypothetical protein ASZ78_000807 [Callipepla squamata]|uniref:BMERB domain-containing protein n=1 Tax=Callipepla squamata TaxID=9009 RepID=A0A226MYR7_CALSU|nr:hypothetical protein ASZ78_000807 [Callipepla squamata]
MKDALRIPDKTAKEHSAGRPRSPLRLIASAFRRSILEPLTSSPEGLKQDSDSKTKASSELAFFSFPSILGHRNTNNRASNSQPEELQIGKQTGEYLGCGNLLSSASKFSVSSEEMSPSGYTKEISFPVYSPHSRTKTPSISQKATCTRMEDVPGLLEKFTFNETSSVAPRDDVFICSEKYPLASSWESRNTSKDGLHDSAQKGTLSFLERLKSKVCEREANFFKSSLPFTKDHSAEDRLHYPSTGCELPPVRKQTAEYFTSSSDEDELESKPSLTHKAKRSLRRRRKLEKETKQLIKQEELKRLHKAQAVQRQLEELEERQRALEIFGVQLERELRGESGK